MKILFITLLCLVSMLDVSASNNKYSARTKLLISNAGALKAKSTNGIITEGAVQAFVSVSSWSAIDSLKSIGATVDAVFDDFVTVTIPISAFPQLNTISGVQDIDVTGYLHLTTDSARSLTQVSKVLNGAGLSQAYDGTGVVVGVIDTGIDFNHLAFRNADGTTRIKCVYLPNDSTGSSPVVNGEKLSGSEYTTAEQIAQLTTDYAKQNHGTHTSGIAAGSTINQYGGMAPGADLVFCGLGKDLKEVDIINGAVYISNYAKSVGKPCVINLSLGNHDGPHDGTGYMAKALDEISKKYNAVFTVSAGNEGGDDLYLHKKLSQNKPLSSFLSNPTNAEVDAWNSNSDTVKVQLSIYQRDSLDVVYKTDVIGCDSTLSFNDSIYSSWISGEAKIAHGRNVYTGKSHVLIDTELKVNRSYILAISFYAKDDDELNVWETTGNCVFEADGVEGFTEASDSCSISDMATGETTISVGAYNDRKQYIRDDGSLMICSYSPIGDLASFSSYGYDMNGVLHPFITAPGRCVISSINSYTSSTASAMTLTNPEGRTNRWYLMSGTSMSAPCVAGIIALWMQANPNLTYSQIKEIMQSTAIRDYFVNQGQLSWGNNGKINAYEGILKALSSGINDTRFNLPKVSVYPNPVQDVLNVICPFNEEIKLTIYEPNGRSVMSQKLSVNDNRATMDVSQLISGLYLLRIQSSSLMQTLKVYKE